MPGGLAGPEAARVLQWMEGGSVVVEHLCRMLQARTASLARDASWIRSCRESVEKARQATDKRAKELMRLTRSRRERKG